MLELFQSGIINKKSLLILNYSKINLNEKQLAIVLIIMELSSYEQRNFTPSQIENYMNITKQEIEQEIADLLKNRFIKIDQKGKKTVLDLSPLFNRLLVKLEEEHSILKVDSEYNFLEKIFNNKLVKEEILKFDEYIESGISKPKILEYIHQYSITNVKDLLLKLEEKSKKSSVKITMYNWLND
ncbi:DnaD family protein [Spiroplasma taiwanense]|uniref:Putative dnad-like replication protein n=1 Tax=Spiroplasma taiwanense CT-1 TaxID=1276220 RepID=S5LWF9_9MOLU|nr:DnaD family protein [Spiroplasma taiwanense]AGR40961.1 putative dnad-like replication protein [Spiroplasma taiwanense CT-1]